MRRPVFVPSTFAIALLASASAMANPFIGTWQLLDGEYVDEQGKTVQYKDLQLTSLKVINQDHFSFTSLSAGKFWSSGAGGYHYDEQTYTETPQYTSYNAPAGQTYEFRYQIQDDQWISERWRDGKRVEREVWQRVDGTGEGNSQSGKPATAVRKP